MPVSLTRRRVLEAGAAAAALIAARPAVAGAASFSLEIPLASRAFTARGRRTTGVLKAPRRFDLIGLDIAGGGHVHAEVRARRRGRAWSAWVPLHDKLQPAWTGPSDEFQVRYSGAPRRLTARFVRIDGRSRPRTRSLAARKAAAGPPTINPRSSWGGDKVAPRSTPDYGLVQSGFVHHTVTANDYAAADVPSIILGIAKYHRDHNGWNDIGYNFVVDTYGGIWEARAGGIDQAVVGAHAQGYNTTSTGVACLGTHSDVPLSNAAVNAVASLLAYKLSLHGVPVTGTYTMISTGGGENRYRAGTEVTLERISGHRDGDNTECPGAALYAQLATIRSKAAARAAPVSALTVTTTRTELQYPATLELSGGLRFADGASAAGQRIDVQFQSAAGAAWTVLQTIATGPDGTFATALPLPGTGRVRTVFPGDGIRPAINATPIRVKVAPQITLTLNPRDGRAGRAVKVTGTIGPTFPTRAQLTFERRAGRRYFRYQRKKVRVRGGKFSTTVRPPRQGLFRVTIEAGGSTIRRLTRAR